MWISFVGCQVAVNGQRRRQLSEEKTSHCQDDGDGYEDGEGGKDDGHADEDEDGEDG